MFERSESPVRDAIAIIDDCSELRHLIHLLIQEEMGSSCLGFATFADVQRRSDELFHCRAILLDINLGPTEPDGVTLYYWLREQGYQGQVFFFTGHAKESPAVRAALHTGVRVLEKPMTPEEIVRLLRYTVMPQAEVAVG